MRTATSHPPPRVELIDDSGTPAHGEAIASLLFQAYVQAGFADRAVAEKIFAPGEVRRRGAVIIAMSAADEAAGMVVCCTSPHNPYRQVADADEAEMQLLAVAPGARERGLGRALCLAFEARALALGQGKAVLSTQSTMPAAHRLYQALGYRRNTLRDWSRGDRRFRVFEKALRAGD